MLNCVTCGRFCTADPGASWKMIYSGCPPTPDREVIRCARCTYTLGPLAGQSGIRPEYAAGIFGAETSGEDSP